MQDIFIDSQGVFDWEVKKDNEVLRSQLGVFLSIRASNGSDDGELDYDINQGLDYDFLFNLSIDKTDKEKYIKEQIKRYFSDIKEVKDVEIIEDKSNREMKINFSFLSIYKEKYEVVEI